ncbi:uncharacterized protein LOC141651397 [Silene latifolia]|uniref:uncharacterized protein LOC141651397 n=1 Tax=Silene latifolia TaxID=37657 RepID=UPI003D778CFF
MALVQKYGKPDLFITMTCNPNWPEIKAELSPGEQAHNRPDLVARIFHAKLTLLRKQIKEKQIFGEVAAMINVVEFQKRGLPHAHFLIILKPEHKITAPEKFDKYVSAEIPSTDNPHLRAVVPKHMLHGPCGTDFPKCACMRWDTGETVSLRKAKLDNRSVVPYNPYLLAMFDCHLNVEVCSTIKAVKYLYKYMYKGYDRILFNVADGTASMLVDEIERYQSSRWVSPPEAAWRIYPHVQPLPLHIPNCQMARFSENEELAMVIADEDRAKTMLTEFFNTNSRLEEEQRDRGVVVGRVAHASPGEGERYYLRLLLAHIRGPKLFEDLKTVNGVCCVSFQEAALKRGVLEEDNAADMCMDEAIQVEMPNALRRLFATILVFSCPNNPAEFWDKYYKPLSDDFRKQFPEEHAKVLQLTVGKVEQFLEGMGKTFSQFGLNHLHFEQETILQSTRDISDALNAPVPLLQLASRKQLNLQQRTAYKAIIQHVKNAKAGAFFIDGPGGTGKTFLYGALYAKVRSMGQICLPTATSGIAASNLPTGRTTHSRFKIPLDTEESITCDVPKQGGLACLIREASLVIWDEASMAKRENIEAVNMLFQDVCSSSQLFGGKVIVFGGDFRQVLSVLPRRTQQEAVEASIVSSPIWPQLTKFGLTENIRAREDPQFSKFFLDLGNGNLQTEESSWVSLPQELILQTKEGEEPEETLINVVFPEMKHYAFNPEIFNDRAILTPRNADVDSVNSALIEMFPGTPHIYHSFDSVVDDNSNVYPAEFLNSLCPVGMTPHELILKEDSPVILLRNLDHAAGLCNGMRLICKRFFPNMIECEISTGFYKGERVFLHRITLKPSKNSKFPINFQRKQFPIKLSFAMTINKAQGQTVQRVGVYLPRSCFSHGQLYVALSRARSARDLKVLHKPSAGDVNGNLVRNVVSFEVLRRAGFKDI